MHTWPGIDYISRSLLLAINAQLSSAVTEIPFSLFRLILLIGWVYLCLYSAQKVQVNPTIADRYKGLANLATLLAGPLVPLLLFLAHMKRKSAEDGRGLIQTIKDHFENLIATVQTIGSKKPEITLLDTSGRNLKEIYGHSKGKSQDRHILDLTEQIIQDALSERASDILIDPRDNAIHTVRFRVDGVLREVDQIASETCQAVINSMKVVAGMDIAEKRRPQDGAFVAKTTDGTVSFRAASAGVLNGEKLSIRVLSQSAEKFQLTNIGLSDKQRLAVEQAIRKPAGMILMCGPTGSGKTTTLYAMLNKIDLYTRNVITVEDPIEYVLPNASQIEVNPKADITFAKSLRSILRQDPDVIVVGEIRDEETAAIALRASQTGHLVLATIHCDSNAAAVIRLLDLGITPMLLSAGLSVIVSQRLLRKLCPHCKRPAKLSHHQMLEFQRQHINFTNMFEAAGCDRCRSTGYIGRMGIFDVLVVNDAIRNDIINKPAAVAQLRKEGDKMGKSNLQKQGLKNVVTGITSTEELQRVLG